MVISQKELLIAAKDKNVALLGKDKALQAAVIQNQQTTRGYLVGGFLVILATGGFSFYNYSKRKKLAFSKTVSETEMKALRAQMNPHFIFNSLNTVHSFVQAGDNKAASEYLLKFSTLTREILENSQHQFISLEDELHALQTYLSLESMRLEKKLEYEVVLSPEIEKENTLIPPLILQPFIENAILHGLQNTTTPGKIRIVINKNGEMLKCVIEDNGIGIAGSTALKKGASAVKKQSLGMKLTEQRIDIINKLKKSNAFVSVTDKLDELKQPAGVQVELMLPLELRF
jgi:sensor histidine kinase YesM